MPRPSGNPETPPEDVLVYRALKAEARRLMSDERTGHTLQPTALVHEAYLRLSADGGGPMERTRFLGLAARVMGNVLVDHARRVNRDKRGGGAQRVTLQAGVILPEGSTLDPVELEEALTALQRHAPHLAQTLRLRFYSGMTTEQAAQELQVSRSKVVKDSRFAIAWLRSHMDGGQ